MRLWVAASAVAVATAGGAAVARGADDPVRLAVSAPARVATGHTLTVHVTLAADPGALDIRDGDLRLQVRLVRGECGGDFAGTPGRTLVDAPLSPQPAPGAAYGATARLSTAIGPRGLIRVCAFAADAADRQFATDVDSTITVVRPRRRGRARR